MASTLTTPGQLSLRVKGFVGTAVSKVPLRGYNEPLTWDGSPIWGLLAELNGSGWRSKVSWHTFISHKNWPDNGTPYISDLLHQAAEILHEPVLHEAATGMTIVGWRETRLNGMFAWDRGPTQFQAEFERVLSNRVIFSGYRCGSLTLGYRLGKVVPFAQYARIVPDAQIIDLGHLSSIPEQGPLLVATVQAILYATAVRQTTVSAGAWWDFAPKTCLKFQVDQVHAPNSTGLFYELQPGWNHRARVFSLTLDFVFGGGS